MFHGQLQDQDQVTATASHLSNWTAITEEGASGGEKSGHMSWVLGVSLALSSMGVLGAALLIH